jgi:hypothetical protein
MSFMLHPQHGILGLPKPVNELNIIIIIIIILFFWWLNVFSVNTTRGKLSKLQEHYNRFQFYQLFGGTFLWISLWDYLNLEISQSSWW